MRTTILALALLLTACGGSTSTGTGPTPPPSSSITVAGTITDTVSHAPVSTFSQTVDRLPALLTISQPGYVTRQAMIGSASPTVDLIKDAAPFSLDFYRQLVRNGYESPSLLQPVTVLTVNPSIYLQTAGLSANDVAVLEQAARAVVPLWSGGHLSVATFESGPALRPDAFNWITVELISDVSDGACGRAKLGSPVGHIWLNIAPALQDVTRQSGCYRPLSNTLSHELGHALGFSHVGDPTCLMSITRPASHNGQPCAAERYHAAIAYSRSSGNRDPDNDAVTSTPLAVREQMIVVD